MRLVLLQAGGYPELLLAAELRSQHIVVLIVEEKRALFSRFWHILTRSESIFKRLDRVTFYVLYHGFMGRILKRQRKFLHRPTTPINPDIVTRNLNHPDLIQRVEEVRPDLVLVSRTSILHKQWFDLGIPMVNVHPGIVPEYRGLDSWMWAVINNEPHNIGVTVHWIEPMVDTGQIIVQDRVEDLDGLRIEPIRARIYHLMVRSMLRAVEMIDNDSAVQGLPENHGRYPAYLEVGLTDFIRFLWRRREILL